MAMPSNTTSSGSKRRKTLVICTNNSCHYQDDDQCTLDVIHIFGDKLCYQGTHKTPSINKVQEKA